jgi:DNA-directed RNA polymerase specialized sigma24 family protein
MSVTANPASLAVEALGDRCCHETAEYHVGRASDPAFCVELFRRALQEGLNAAWEKLMTCFTPSVRAWFRRHPKREVAAPNGDGEPFVAEAFARMWVANASKPLTIGTLPQLLTFLRRCLHTSVMDEARARERADPFSSVLAGAGDEEDGERDLPDKRPGVERKVFGDIARDELLRQMLGCARDDRERRVLLLRWVRRDTPAEIARDHPLEFPEVREIYKIVANLLARYVRRYGWPKGYGPQAGGQK